MVTLAGSAFHARAPATGNARSPSEDRRVAEPRRRYWRPNAVAVEIESRTRAWSLPRSIQGRCHADSDTPWRRVWMHWQPVQLLQQWCNSVLWSVLSVGVCLCVFTCCKNTRTILTAIFQMNLIRWLPSWFSFSVVSWNLLPIFLENLLINISKQYCGSQKPAVWHSAHDVLELVESKRCVIVLLTERFFRRSVLRESSCLHYLLPDKRDSTITDRLRHAKNIYIIPH